MLLRAAAEAAESAGRVQRSEAEASQSQRSDTESDAESVTASSVAAQATQATQAAQAAEATQELETAKETQEVSTGEPEAAAARVASTAAATVPPAPVRPPSAMVPPAPARSAEQIEAAKATAELRAALLAGTAEDLTAGGAEASSPPAMSRVESSAASPGMKVKSVKWDAETKLQPRFDVEKVIVEVRKPWVKLGQLLESR